MLVYVYLVYVNNDKYGKNITMVVSNTTVFFIHLYFSIAKYLSDSAALCRMKCNVHCTVLCDCFFSLNDLHAFIKIDNVKTQSKLGNKY